MPTEQVAFKLKNSLKELDHLNDHLDLFRARVGLTNKCCCEINLALEELFTNYVSHGHKGRKAGHHEHQIHFKLSVAGGVLTIRIEDDGKPFDPGKAKAPDTRCPLEQRKIGGLGVHLIRKVMDDISYIRCGGKNIITLKKQIVQEKCRNGKNPDPD